jgi:hypothetical protein
MTVRMYSSLDTGAPDLSAANTPRLLDTLRIILRACLVDGYGAKEAAGWTLGHQVADGFSLSNGEGVINFVHTNTANVEIYLMESITDPSTPLAGGVNRRSGFWFDGEATTSRQVFYSSAAGSAAKSWALVADDKTVTVMVQGGATAVDNTNSANAQALHFGRYFPVLGGVGFCVLPGNSQYGTGNFWASSNQPGTCLRNPYTNLIPQGAAPGYALGNRAGIDRTSNIQFPTFMPRVLQLYRAGLLAGGPGLSGAAFHPNTSIYAGALRGLLVDPFVGIARLSQILGACGVASPVVNDRLKAVTVGGKAYWPMNPHISDLTGFVSLEAEDWGPLWT